MERSAGGPFSPKALARLAVLAFLHDAGKLHPGFQAKGWPPGTWPDRLHGHVREGAAIFLCAAPEIIGRNLRLEALIDWGVERDLLFAALAHHGRPFAPDGAAGKRWHSVPSMGYDPVAASAEIGRMMPSWFPAAFAPGEAPLPATPDFQHLFCGLVSLADWLGSDKRVFGFVAELDTNYICRARQRARRIVVTIGLDARALQGAVAGRAGFAAVAGFDDPRPQQRLVGDYPLDEQLVILEAETGSGKTEAALWRFARLFEAGLVDSLYFALPTRAAAMQLHGRVNRALERLFGDRAPKAVLAVPGYLKAGEVEGVALPDWRVRWDDEQDSDEEELLARWAAESAKRYLAATVAVGTVDQAMLAALQVKHAHLRAAALSRGLLVIDEVHASDRYMTEVQNHLLGMHLQRGGHAMLMSATLGSIARTKWLRCNGEPTFDEAVAAPYPAVWGMGDVEPRGAEGHGQPKSVAVTLISPWSADNAAHSAMAAAHAGARVLVIRNTVTAAIDTFDAARLAGGDDLLLPVASGPALHHGRFAPEDRKLLDEAAETVLSPELRSPGGVIVIGTQTLEQSLDIDADFLITDLCPVDVLLQRIGRLHRHPLDRPKGFEGAQCLVMVPEHGLAPLLKPGFENGLGMLRDGGGVYRDLSVLELTRRLIADHREWIIPAMNRLLVESATHPERIEALHAELGPEWETYQNIDYGREVADAGAARRIGLPVDEPFAEVRFVSDEEKIRTRLGAEGARIIFAEPVKGPFGAMISGVTLPAHWSRGVDTSQAVVPAMEGGTLCWSLGGAAFLYDRKGVMREKR